MTHAKANFVEQAQRFADQHKAPELGYTKEFYQISCRVIGLRRRVSELFDCVKFAKDKVPSILSRCSGDDFKQPLAQLCNTSMEALLAKLDYIEASFVKLNTMVRI